MFDIGKRRRIIERRWFGGGDAGGGGGRIHTDATLLDTRRTNKDVATTRIARLTVDFKKYQAKLASFHSK